VTPRVAVGRQRRAILDGAELIDEAARFRLLAHHDSPPFSGRPSLTGHCGHGWTCSLPRPVAIDIWQLQDGTVKKGLHRPRLGAIIPNLTAAGSHPDCRAVLIQIVALYRDKGSGGE
jgi:hypothetical protein